MFDWSWLGELFSGMLHLFDPLKAIAHWKIWAQIYDIYKRVKGWEDWYKKHVLAQIQAEQKLFHQIVDTWVKPVLKIIDTIRRLSGLVGLFNKQLATRLNLMFTRVEGYILLPFNKATQRLNQIQNVFTGFLTPLGYFDRSTLLNSIWRDIGLIGELLRNPLGKSIAAGTGTPAPSVPTRYAGLRAYFAGQASDIQPAVDGSVTTVRSLIGQIDQV